MTNPVSKKLITNKKKSNNFNNLNQIIAFLFSGFFLALLLSVFFHIFTFKTINISTMQKMTREEFNEKYKNDPVFKSAIEKLMSRRATNKEEETDLEDDNLEQVSGGTEQIYQEIQNELWMNK